MQSNLVSFIQVLRTHDVRISPAETLDAMDAVKTLGYADRSLLRDGLAMTLAKTPEEEAVAADYVAAGSRAILTNTFGASRFMLERHGLDGQVVEINRIGAEISKRAAGERAAVFGSIGPTGRMLMTGECTEDELLEGLWRVRAAFDGVTSLHAARP